LTGAPTDDIWNWRKPASNAIARTRPERALPLRFSIVWAKDRSEPIGSTTGKLDCTLDYKHTKVFQAPAHPIETHTVRW